MNKKQLITRIALGIIILIGVVLVIYAGGSSTSRSNSSNSQNQNQTATTQTQPPTLGEKTFTVAQVSQHNSESSCYTIVNGNVYDVTAFINQHPGGSEKILAMCGVDATSAFTQKHGGQSRPVSELANLKIGVLAQ